MNTSERIRAERQLREAVKWLYDLNKLVYRDDDAAHETRIDVRRLVSKAFEELNEVGE